MNNKEDSQYLKDRFTGCVDTVENWKIEYNNRKFELKHLSWNKWAQDLIDVRKSETDEEFYLEGEFTENLERNVKYFEHYRMPGIFTESELRDFLRDKKREKNSLYFYTISEIDDKKTNPMYYDIKSWEELSQDTYQVKYIKEHDEWIKVKNENGEYMQLTEET